MHLLIFITATAVLLLKEVAAEGVIGIKKGTFPFMAFIYYPDQTVHDSVGGKFTRSGVLISQNWLISSSLESENSPIAFPEKTLVARLGAISIDTKFNLNEDEDEQEREIIRIARPYDFNNTEWWYYDISLLKTLLPFNITSAVATFVTRAKKLNFGDNCFMLIYAVQNQSATEERILMKVPIELILSRQECGSYFSNDTMVCAAPSDEKNGIYTNTNFCLGNSGGPLICGSELIGTQTYIDNCNPPYLFQLLNPWEDLITCAMEEKCQEEQCAKICFTINKDQTTVTTTTTTTNIVIIEDAKFKLLDGIVNKTSSDIIIVPTFTTIKSTTPKPTSITVEKTSEREIITVSTTTTEKQDTTETLTASTISTSNMVEDSSSDLNENTEGETTEFTEERERKTNVEAKQHIVRNDASINMLYSFNYFIILLIL